MLLMHYSGACCLAVVEVPEVAVAGAVAVAAAAVVSADSEAEASEVEAAAVAGKIIALMDIVKWKTLSSKYLVKEKWATLRVDVCDLQNGLIKDDYFVLEYPNWVNAIAVTKENKIILVRQYRHGGDIISLEVPGGVIDGDESPETAIKRELLEETGYSFYHIEPLVTTYPNPATANNVTFTYLLTGGTKTHSQHLDEHEILQVEEYSIEDVRKLLENNEIAQALHCTALFYGLLKLGALK